MTTILETNESIYQIVKNTWMSILNVDEINEYDSFFDLNGDSLQALKMLELIKDKHNIELFIQDIYQNETLKEFVQYVEMKSNPYEITVKGHVNADIAQYNMRVTNEEVVRCLKEYNNNILNQVANTYKMLKFHRYFIRMGYTDYLSILSTVINVENCKSVEILLAAVKQLVNEQAVLRTGVSDDGRYMVEYECNDWNIPVIEKRSTDSWEEFIENLGYVRNEHDFFGKNGLLSKILILKLSDTDYEVRVFIHHCIWDRMSHIIVVKRLDSILNNLKDSRAEIQSYNNYVESKRALLLDQIHFQYKMGTKFLIPVIKYKKAISRKKCFDITVCWEPNKNYLKEFGDKPVHKIAELYYDICRNLGIKLKKIPLSILINGRNSENSTTLGMYFNTISGIYNPDRKKIYGVINENIDSSNNVKLQFEMCNTRLFELFSKSIPIINYVGLFPGYHDTSKTLLEIKELELDKPVENRLTSFIDDNRIHLTFKVYADSEEEAASAINKLIS